MAGGGGESPEEFMPATVMGDLNLLVVASYRVWSDMVGGGKAIKAEVPLAEMFGYSTTICVL